ncbi:MAG: AAA family ATPase [Chloroflexi bacterium]|nr:AAA family ATPase [Chloroflexota bacterium]
MIGSLRISHFKSIRELALSPRRLNIFIGRPNAGKSNILESLGLMSFLWYGQFGYSAGQFVRFERTSNLFYDEALDQPLEISCDDRRITLGFKTGFEGVFSSDKRQPRQALYGGHGALQNSGGYVQEVADFKAYRFSQVAQFKELDSDCLVPPFGENLLSLLLSNRELRATVNQPFSSMGLRLNLRPQEGKLEVIKQLEDVIVSYPYSLASETLQRLTFHIAAILTNKQSIIILEEPESHAFPYYTKYLAELISLDRNENQYFISTHNPYFLLPIVSKAPSSDVQVYLTYYEDYETRVKPLSEQDLAELGEIDAFSNLDRYLEAK